MYVCWLRLINYQPYITYWEERIPWIVELRKLILKTTLMLYMNHYPKVELRKSWPMWLNTLSYKRKNIWSMNFSVYKWRGWPCPEILVGYITSWKYVDRSLDQISELLEQLPSGKKTDQVRNNLVGGILKLRSVILDSAAKEQLDLDCPNSLFLPGFDLWVTSSRISCHPSPKSAKSES